MYSIHGYGLMLADPRADAYALALRQVVAPGAVVVDLGSGPGIWALYACSLGARRVFAIEPDDVINLGIQAARANGFDDRITFIQRDSRDVSLDEPADVVVADVRDVLPLSAAGLSTMIDSRRFLSPGGTIVPARDTLWVAVVHAPAAHHATVGPWDERCFGLDFTAARRAAVSLPRKERFGPDDLVAPPAAWAALDYRTLASPAVAGSARLSAARSGLAHGLAVWFESELVDGVRLSNRPGDPPLLYGQSFLPWPAPVALEAGDAIDLELRAAPAGETSVLVWNTRAIHASSGREFARFAQSTFDGLPLSVSSLRARPEAGEA
jgi:protein arginine N-methyltransferase 1